MLRILSASDGRGVARLLSPAAARDAATDRLAARIVARVRREGDRAVLDLARRFDGLDGPIELDAAVLRAEARTVPASTRRAIAEAARNIRIVASRQVPRGWRARVTPGATVEQRVIPLDRVGCYVPGGRYPLPSSLLMTAIPAQAAGVGEVIVACPRPGPAVCAAAIEAGVARVFRIGGAHAIAAMAYGTRRIPRVDKVVGPGNRFVAAAKAIVAADCGIDFHAGPTEILIVSSRGRADWIAADMIAQAEHDPDARAVLITPSRRLAERVAREVARLAPESGPVRSSLSRNGGIVVTRRMRDAIALANAAAPEHLVVDDEAAARRVTCAGSLFVGGWSAQVAGDYAIGSNHVLPTAGAARFRGGLSAADFVRQITVQRVTRAGLRRLAPAVIDLARAEGLEGHARSIEARMNR